VVHPYCGTYFSAMQINTTDTQNNLDALRGVTLNERKLISKGYILYDSIYVKFFLLW